MRFCIAVVFIAITIPNVTADQPLQFNRDIRPILSEKCFFCHGPDANHREADLRLDIESEAKLHSIVDGDADDSELFQRIISTDADAQMPPPDSGKKLSPAEIQILRQWIGQGAPYEGHWSFIPPTRPDLPNAGNSDWAQHPIDRFVLAGLRAENLTPSPQADPSELIRRLSLDLTGLPPTIDEVRNFVSDDSDDAYEKVVDHFLQSRRFGEHMARYWLDAARYADTNGYQYDLEREQWVWRDWVIHAFNTNMPFDQFTIQQLAGDLLPQATDSQRLATGFHRNHPITIEGGVIDEEYRTEYVIDRVVTTSTVWMGLTMTCARCHDHKYDPISQREFYQFYAFFNNINERGLNGFNPKAKIPSPLLQQQIELIESRVAEAQRQFDATVDDAGLSMDQLEALLVTQADHWKTLLPTQMTSAGGATLEARDDQSVLVGGNNPATDTYEVVLTTDAPRVNAIRLEALTDPSTVNGGTGRGSNGNFVLSEFEVEVAPAGDPTNFTKVALADAEADYSQNKFDIKLAIDGKVDRTGWAVDGHQKIENRLATFSFREPVGSESGSLFRIRMIHQYGGSHHIARFRLQLHQSDKPPVATAIAAILKKGKEKRSAAEQNRLREDLLERYGSADVQLAAARLREFESERDRLAKSYPETMVMAELPTPRKTHLLMRGEYDKPSDEVQAETPQALPPMPDDLPRNRLGLARWLVMPDHPLTSRVAVNRLWQQLFGSGIVKTTEDFGSQGDWPSHPELLDWLAVEFVQSDWDTKALLKTIVMSSTYRQSSRMTPQLQQTDPDNRFLARGPSMRLDAEVIRDSALTVAGLLGSRIGGPSVFPYQPSGLWQEINNRPGYSRTYKQDSGEKLYRRSMYTFWKRTVPPPSMAAFDAPEREFCRVRRSRTNTPLQAFVMLHDPQFVEAARHLAGRMLHEGGTSNLDRMVYGFRLCFARKPTKSELDVLTDELTRRLAQYQSDTEAANKLLAVGESPVDETLAPADLAAWTSVGRLLLNLSEFVTKP